MPTTALTHDQNRSKVCLICFQKGKKDTIRSTESPQNLKKIQEFFMENYDPSDLKLPAGLCACCKTKLDRMEIKKSGKDKDKPLPEVILPDPVDFTKLVFPPTITRSRGGDLSPCSCDICEIATQTPFTSPTFKKRPHTLGRPKKLLPTLPAAKPITICQRCRQVIGKGISHPQPCTLSDMRQNMRELSLQDPRGRELAAVEVVKELAEATGTSSYIPLSNKSGASLNVSIEKPSTSKAMFEDKPVSVEEFDKVSEKLRLSRNQQKDLATGLRVWKGRDFLEPRLDQKLAEKHKTGAEYFAIERCEIDCKTEKGENVRKFMPVFFCKAVGTHLNGCASLQTQWAAVTKYFLLMRAPVHLK